MKRVSKLSLTLELTVIIDLADFYVLNEITKFVANVVFECNVRI